MENNILKPEFLQNQIGENITVPACVMKIQKGSGIMLLTVRHNGYMYRAVYIPDLCKASVKDLCEGAFAEFFVTVKSEKRAMYGFELTIKDFRVLAKPQEGVEADLTSPIGASSLNEQVQNRVATLRNREVIAVLSVRSVIANAFSRYMAQQGFVNIQTPKIAKRVLDSTGYITVNYFDKSAMLTPSPSVYKIISVAALDRVYEMGSGYYGVNKNSRRHLNEYTRYDFELAYGDANTAINVFEGLAEYIMKEIEENCKCECELLNADLPKGVCSFRFGEVMDILGKTEKQDSLDPTDERKICEYAKLNCSAEYVFVTELPNEKRPFYEKDNTGFVLLLRGMEIASGGEGISNLAEQREKMERMGVDEKEYSHFIEAYKLAMPSHCGGTMGAERFAMQLLGLSDIRAVAHFVRDLHHIEP